MGIPLGFWVFLMAVSASSRSGTADDGLRDEEGRGSGLVAAAKKKQAEAHEFRLHPGPLPRDPAGCGSGRQRATGG